MRLLIAGGGTGGHLYPGIAVAEEVMARPGSEVLFVGTARGIEARAVPAAGYELEVLDVSGLKGMGAIARARGLVRLPNAFARSLQILKRFRPDVVLGVGGYASGPLVLAAALARYPTAIHEQNSVPGFTNRVLARVARVVFVAFEDAQRSFGARPTELVGNPVRQTLLAAAARPRDPQARKTHGSVLVVGGSQGARAVNDLVLDAVARLAQEGRLPEVVHQAGPADAARCSQRYREMNVDASVTVWPFIDDMVAAYEKADLVVGRAGALTLAELAIVRKPALLIPLPTAADDHQTRNAAAFEQAGAAVVLDQRRADGGKLAAALTSLLPDEARLRDMAGAMSRLARPHAARMIVDRLETIGQPAS